MFIQCEINGKIVAQNVEENRRVLDFLREDLVLTGTKCGCEIGECGACTILLDNIAVNSCLLLVSQVHNKKIETIENINNDVMLQQLSESFQQKGGIQCGFCTPGMMLSAKALLLKNANPTVAEIKTALEGNLCRCTGYQPIIDSILDAISKLS